MRSERIAERVLALFVGRVKAASVVGDLAEVRGERGARWFWWSYADILLAASWRPVVAFVVVAAGYWYGGRYLVGGAWLSRGGSVGEQFVGVTAMVGALSAFVFLYAALRYGLGDRLTRLALGFAVTGQVAGFFFFVNGMAAMAAAAYVVLCGTALLSASGRRALGAIAGLCVAFDLVERVGLRIFRWVPDHGWLNVNSGQWQWWAWVTVCYVGGLAVCAWLCARAHGVVSGGREVAQG
jgi:hypothetical protein